MATFKTVPFALHDAPNWNGLTRETHLINAFGDDPMYLDKIIRNIYKVNWGMSFDEYLNQFSIKYIDEDGVYKWKLKARDERNIPLLAAWEDEDGTAPVGTSNPRPGLNGSKIYADFPEDYFSITSVIVGEKPDLYHLRVQSEPRMISNDVYRYELQLVTGDDNLFVPVSELKRGTRWSLDYALSERYLSKDGMDLSFSSPFSMQNRVSMFRLKHVVPGEMIDKGKNRPLKFAFMNDDGTVQEAWLSHLEYKWWKEYLKVKNRLVFYGKSTLRDDGTSTLLGSSGNPIEAGLGIREQISPSNKHYYDNLTWDLLVNTLLEHSIGRDSMEDRNFVIGTGTYGLQYLHKLVANHLGANDYKWMNDSTGRAYEWTGNDLHVKTGQFKGFATISGLKVSFMHLDHYDDYIRNKINHPNGGPAESNRMTIMNMGSKNEPNIHKIRVKGTEPTYGIVPGMRDPFSQGGKGRPKMMATSVDGYEMHVLDKEGAVVLDPSSVIEFIPAILK